MKAGNNSSFESDVCAYFPFDVSKISSGHLQVTGALATIAVAAFVIVFAVSSQEDAALRQRREASFFLLLASLGGLLAAYSFSATTGDRCLLATIEWAVPSTMFVAAGLLLVGGLMLLVYGHPDWGRPASLTMRFFLVVIAILLTTRVATDLSETLALGTVLRSIPTEQYGPTQTDSVLRAWANTLPGDDVPQAKAAAKLWAGITGPLDRRLFLIGGAGIATGLLGHRRRTPIPYGQKTEHQSTWVVILAFTFLVFIAFSSVIQAVYFSNPDVITTIPEWALLIQMGSFSALVATTLSHGRVSFFQPPSPKPRRTFKWIPASALLWWLGHRDSEPS